MWQLLLTHYCYKKFYLTLSTYYVWSMSRYIGEKNFLTSYLKTQDPGKENIVKFL